MAASFQMRMKDILNQRENFQLAPNSTPEPELPLLEKQAIIDEALRGYPLRAFECYTQETPNGTMYFVTKGWARLSALFDFADDKFPTWDEKAIKRWQRGQQK